MAQLSNLLAEQSIGALDLFVSKDQTFNAISELVLYVKR
jgi:hypothetical protein